MLKTPLCKRIGFGKRILTFAVDVVHQLSRSHPEMYESCRLPCQPSKLAPVAKSRGL